MSEMLQRKFKSKIEGSEDINFKYPEEYFYALGQFVVYVFEKMGGADKYRKEFCFLTCPNVSCDAKRLNKRNVHFLENVDKLIKIEDENVKRILDEIFEWNSQGKIENINLKMCEEAFYDGVYEENMLMSYEKINLG